MQKISFVILGILLFFGYFLISCVTPAQRDAMQRDINVLNQDIDDLHKQIRMQSKQTDRNTKTTLSSQTDLQMLQSSIAECSGDIDALKMRIQRIEETGSSNLDAYKGAIDTYAKKIAKLQRQVALLEVKTTTIEEKIFPSEKIKQSFQPKNANDVTKSLKVDYEKGWFKNVILKASMVIQSSKSTSDMINVALRFRGEAKFKLADYSGAIVDLTQFTQNSSLDVNRARALLLIGDAYAFLKNNDAAKSYYLECAESFGKTTEGKACLERVKNLVNVP